MATPVQQNSFSSARNSGTGHSDASFLWAEMQNAAVKKAGTPDCRIPGAPVTPRVLNQVQQRNIVRQWNGLPPIESNWQRASRQPWLAADQVVRTAGESLEQMASRAAAYWEGMREFTGASFIPALPGLHIGPPGAAAQTPVQPPAQVCNGPAEPGSQGALSPTPVSLMEAVEGNNLEALKQLKGTGRDEHLAWAKERALDYVNQGDLQSAVASMISNLGKHPELDVFDRVPQLALIGLMDAMAHDTDGVRRWIKGFN